MTLLTDLPDDVLINVFYKLDQPTLLSLRLVCRRLKYIADHNYLWKRRFFALYSHQPHWIDAEKYNYKERCVFTTKILRDRLTRSKLYGFNQKFLIPWVRVCPLMPTDHIVVSNGTKLERFSTNKLLTNRSTAVDRRKHKEDCNADICRFVAKQQRDKVIVVGGTRDGNVKLCLFNKIEPQPERTISFLAHDSDIHCSDILIDQSVVFSGSRDRTVKLWKADIEKDWSDFQPELLRTIGLDDRAWCLLVEPAQQKYFAVGSAACNECPPVTVFDTETGQLKERLGQPCRQGAGVLDLTFMSPTLLLTGGYDSTARLWDLRIPSSSNCCWFWNEPYNNTVFSLASDNNNAIFLGAARHSLIWLLDTRWSKALQHYYISSENHPVYSLAANTRTVYGALDTEIRALRV